MPPAHMGAYVRHVSGSMRAVWAAESWQLTALEFRVIVEIVLVTEYAGTGRAGKLLFFSVGIIDTALLIATTPLAGSRSVREIAYG